MEGTSPSSNAKALNRFLDEVEPWMPLLRLFDENAPFVVGDVTEVERRQAKRTSYVGTLKDGKTRGFWMLTLGTPRGGRVLPFHFVTSSSQTPRRPSRRRLPRGTTSIVARWQPLRDC